jgi:hypothetical protein
MNVVRAERVSGERFDRHSGFQVAATLERYEFIRR